MSSRASHPSAKRSPQLVIAPSHTASLVCPLPDIRAAFVLLRRPYAIRTRRPPFELAHGTDFHRFLAANPEASLAHDSAMESTVEDFAATVSRYDHSTFETVADVGGGSGAFLVTLLRVYPDVRGVCFDLLDVIESARMRGIPRDVADRLELLGSCTRGETGPIRAQQ